MSSGQIVHGGLYWVADDALSLPPNDNRTLHPRRLVVVMSGADTNSDPAWPVVLVVPLSSQSTLRTRFCVKISAGEGNSTKKTWVRVPAVQPLMKSDLQDHCGVLPATRVEEIQARIFEYMGLGDLLDAEEG